MPSAWKFWWCPNHGDWGASTSGAFSSSCLIDLPGPRLCRRSNLQRIRQPEPQRSTLEPAGELQHDCRNNLCFSAWVCTVKFACWHPDHPIYRPHCSLCCKKWCALAQPLSATLLCRCSASKPLVGEMRTFSGGFIFWADQRPRGADLDGHGHAQAGNDMWGRPRSSLG